MNYIIIFEYIISEASYGYTHWAHGEPNNSPVESDCMTMWVERDYWWDDVACSNSPNIYTGCMVACVNNC